MTIGRYILSVVCLVIVCGVLQLLLQDGSVTSVVKIVCGLAVIVAVLSPLIYGKTDKWMIRFEDLVQNGSSVVSEGQIIASNMYKQHIKEKTESYIIAKASALGADISIDIELASEYPNSPDELTLKGNISPYAKQQLCKYLVEELGVPEENQLWIS